MEVVLVVVGAIVLGGLVVPAVRNGRLPAQGCRFDREDDHVSPGAPDAPCATSARPAMRRPWVALAAALLVVVPTQAEAFELSSGVSLGGILVGTIPRLAVSPHVGISWRMEGGVSLGVQDVFPLLPPRSGSGVGVYNHTSVAIGYAWEDGTINVGPSLSIYTLPACGAMLCGRVVGAAPGGLAQVNLYLTGGPLGVSLSAGVDWIGGSSLVLPGGVVAMVVAGPVFRLSSK